MRSVLATFALLSSLLIVGGAVVLKESAGAEPAGNNVPTDIKSGLVAHWKFDETSGATASDSSGNEHHGSLQNNVRFTTEGKVNNALELDGNNGDQVSVPAFDVEDGTGLTIAAWVKPTYADVTDQDDRIISKCDPNNEGTDYHTWMLGLRDGTGAEDGYRVRTRVRTGGDTDPTYLGDPPEGIVSPGEWTHIAFTWDGSTGAVVLYKNANEVHRAATPRPGALDIEPGKPVAIGDSPGGVRPFQGLIDEVRIYNRALTAEDMLELAEWMGGAGAAATPNPAEAGQTVTLIGSGPDDATSFTWEQIVVADEPVVTLSDANSATTTFDAPVREVGYILTFQLTVVSPSVGTATDEVVIRCTAPNEPRIAPENFRQYPAHLGYRLEWDPLVDADDYGVGFKVGPGMYFWFWTNETFYDLENLTEGQATEIAVKGRNKYGDGVVSDDVRLVPMGNYALPANLGGTNPPSDHVYVISHYTITDMNDTEVENDTNDSWDGQYKTEDYWGFLWPDPIYVDHVTYFTGNMFGDGGWFRSLKVQYTKDGTEWIDVPTSIVPQYDFTDQRSGKKPFTRYDMFIPTLRGVGVRIYGTPGGTATFTSVSELEAFGDNVTARPLVVQGIDAEVPERSTGTIDASFSFSTRGDITSMIYSQISGPSVTITVTGDPLIATFEAPGVDADTELVFEITGSDGTDTLTDEVTIIVKNLVTTAIAGPDQRVADGSDVTLDGSASISTTGTLTYLWTQTGGTDVGVSSSTDAAVPFMAPVLWGHVEELTFQLEVNDGAGGVTTDEVVIKVTNSLTASVFEVYPIDDPAAWQFQGSANYDEGAGILEITPAINNQRGSAFLTETIDCTRFQANFKLYIGDGNGADGMVFGWLRGPSFMGGGGGSLGWYAGGLSGYGIVFDTYPQDQNMNRVSFENPEVHGMDSGGYASYEPPIDMENAGWFDVEVLMDNGHLQVWMTNELGGLDRTLAIDYTLADYTGFDAHFGFTGATGGLNNNHWVDALPAELSDAYAVRELPTSYQAGGTVDVELSVRVNQDNKPPSVTISEAIPGGLTVVDAGGGTQIGSSLSWSFSGDSVATQVLSYTLGVPADTTGALNFTGTVSFPTTDSIKGDMVVYEVPSAPETIYVDVLLAANVSWSGSPEEGVVGYRLYRSVNGQAWEEVAFVSTNSYIDGSVVEGNTYNYQVAAVNAGGIQGPASQASGENRITMVVREAEDFNYGGGLYPGPGPTDVPAVEAPGPDDFGAGYDYLMQGTGGPRPNVYRPKDDIDVREINPGQFIMGYTTTGDWWRYTFDVPAPGPGDPEGGWVKFVLKASCPNGGTVDFYWDEVLVGSVSYVTGSWGTYDTFPLEDQIQTTPGVHTLRVYKAAGELDIDTIGVGFNWTKPTREDLFADDFETYTNLYVPDDLLAAGYTVVNGAAVPEGGWRLWNTAGDDLGAESPAIAAMTSNYVITDSDLGGAVEHDEELITPVIDCTNHRGLRLDVNYNYRTYPDDTTHAQIAEMDIRTSDDGVVWGDWTNLARWDTSTVADSESGSLQVDLSAIADGKHTQIRFHYYDANFDYWFAVDDLRVSGDKLPISAGEILSVGYVEGVADLTWEVFGDGNYTVQYTADLTSGSWDPIPDETWPITDTTWSGDISAILGQGVYLRVRSE